MRHDPDIIEVSGCLFESAGHEKNWATGAMDPAWWTSDIREDGPSGEEINASLVRHTATHWSVRIRFGEAAATTPEAAFAEALKLQAQHARDERTELARYASNREVHIRRYGDRLCGEQSKYVGIIDFLAPLPRFELVTCVACLKLQIEWATQHQQGDIRALSRTLRRVSQAEMPA